MTGSSEIRTLGDIPRLQARVRPDKSAFVFGQRETSYRELDEHSNRVANGLAAEGVEPQDRVAFLDRNSERYFELFFGCAKANVVMVAVNWRLAPPELRHILEDSGARVLFVGEEFLPAVEKIRDRLPRLREVIVVSGDPGRHADYVAWRDRQQGHDPRVTVEPGDTAIQMYTSGTTGRPKGVQLPHYSFLALRLPEDDPRQEDWQRWRSDEVSLVAMPVFHIAGTGWGVQGAYYGARNVVVADFVPAEVLSILERERISKLFMVPAAILFVLNDPACPNTDFSSLKYVLYGASPIPLDLLRRAMEVFQCEFVQVYGMTETCGQATYLPPEEHDPDGNERMRSAGKALPGVELAVVDAAGNRLPPREVGEICVRSPSNMAGYWNLPEATRETMRDGWVRTGDAGYMDEGGYVYMYDRIKDMIVSGGENIYPAEIESALYGHPGIADVAVIGVPDERWGEVPRAVVVARDAALNESDVIAWARENLAGYKVPKSVDFVGELPRNPSGKLLKRELRAPYWDGRERRIN
ncbi:MAG TPA: fatty acid--CoA ligase [Gammaproteobacteria bacterium]|nr:fatty acid--CoA ligase [Gammaproteobacteria bacterium]